MDNLKQYENLKIDEICRICLSKKSEMLVIKDTNLESLLARVTIVHVLEVDRSHFLCTDCLKELDNWSNFNEKLIQSFKIGHWLMEKRDKTELDAKEQSINFPHDAIEIEDIPTEIFDSPFDTTDETINLEPIENLESDADIQNLLPEIEEIKIKIGSDKSINNIDLKTSKEENVIPSESLIIIQHGQSDIYECPKCNKQFSRIQNLREHMMRHYNLRNFACSLCCKTFYKPFEVVEHMRTHTGERPFMCEYCTKTFTRAFILRNHIEKEHNSIKQFLCKICDKVFVNNYRLKIHNRIHTGEKPYKCVDCEKSFAVKCQLTSHIRYKHTKEKDQICNFCAKAFTARSTLEAHLKTHRGEKPKGKHLCSICDKKCLTTTHLKTHIKAKHTGEREFSCELCDKSFFTKHGLQFHVRTHTGERPFVCSICGKTFALKCTLTTHVRRHTGERPYECHICHKKYIHSNTLNIHKRRAHK